MRYVFLLGICIFSRFLSYSQEAPLSEEESRLREIFSKKTDVDFTFYRGGGRTSSMKYFLRNDTLWFGGTNLYTTVIPLGNIDFNRQFYYFESSLYKNKDGAKAIELSLWAAKGKHYEKEYEIEAFKAADDGDDVEIATLILPDKALAEAFVKYLQRKS